MKCIIVNDDTSMRKLIAQKDDMQFVSAFNTTSDASVFMKNIKIDVVFLIFSMVQIILSSYKVFRKILS